MPAYLVDLTQSARDGQLPIIYMREPEIGKLVQILNQTEYRNAYLLGETGVGKNMIAQIIHSLSRRRQGKFVEFSCAAVSEQFLESDLFGHERGAFAGAHREKPGKFELADHGTIFLDEIGELAHELQAKLLRVLQGGEFERIGGLKTVKVDVRVIASTNHNLEKAIAEGRFREDLFYRLNVLSILIPTLRERREDIPFLVERFLRFYSKKSAKRFEKISDDIMNGLIDYSWPGNVRELQNVIERAVVLGREPRLEFSDFALSSSPGPHLAESPISPETSEDAFHSLRELEQKTLLDAIRRSSGNVAKAARILGISRGTVYRRLRKYDIGLKSALG